MRAAIIERRGGALRLEEVDLAEPGRGEVRVKIEACGICRSDLHAIVVGLPELGDRLEIEPVLLLFEKSIKGSMYGSAEPPIRFSPN